jgi:hypothetical protein
MFFFDPASVHDHRLRLCISLLKLEGVNVVPLGYDPVTTTVHPNHIPPISGKETKTFFWIFTDFLRQPFLLGGEL